ncbi:MAG: hypothetical protein K0R17_2230 [Rariglobus sp.]|jgi:hypothetical protein|nr:hypothetical protein [Rariglobus sp.]
MHLAPPRSLFLTDADTGAPVFECPMPILAQIEDCIRLDTPAEGVIEDALSRHQRIIAQLLVLTVPNTGDVAADNLAKSTRTAWLRSLQYHQLLDLHRKMMLWVQGIDFETQEQFEAALEAQKKSTLSEPLNPEPSPSPDSASSACASP